MVIKRIEVNLSKTLDFRYVDRSETKEDVSIFWLDRLSEKGTSFNLEEAKALKMALGKILSIVSEDD